MAYQGRRRVPALLVCIVLALGFALAVVPLWAMRRVQAQHGALSSGPLYDGAYFYVPVALLMAGLLGAVTLTQRRTGFSKSGDILKALASGTLGLPAACLLLGCVLSAAYGCSAYWYATPDGIIVQPGWPAQPRSYARRDMRERLISCTHYKGRTAIVFDVLMRDGSTVSFGNGTPGRLEAEFGQIVALTDKVERNQVGSFEACPGYLKEFVQHLGSVAGLPPR